jgi:tetratricopeptide (TPR) repeat protein
MSGRRVAALAILCALAGAVACGSRPENSEDGEGGRGVTELPQPGPELSDELMLGLALVQNYHHKADVYLKEARFEEAVNELRKILSVQFPAGSPEGIDLVQDARARLARLLVAQGKLDEATKVVDGGIASADRQSFFLANLHTVRGEVLEARAAVVEDKDARAAAAARRQAIEAYDRAIAIEKALIEQLAGGDSR